MMALPQALTLCENYLAECGSILRRIVAEEADALGRAAARLADQIVNDGLVHIYGPGGHSNLATQELFYRAGGLMNLAPIFDAGTSLTNGAFRSTAVERLPGYGEAVIATSSVGPGDVLVLVNAFGINAAVIDAATAARDRDATVIGLSSRAAAEAIPPCHASRHPSGKNLHDLVHIAIDTKIPDGDAALIVENIETPVGPVATIANAFALNTLLLHTICELNERGERPPLWLSRNAAAGDRNDVEQVEAMRRRVPSL